MIYIALLSIKRQSESTLLWSPALPLCVQAPCLTPRPYSTSGFCHYLKCPANLVPPCCSVPPGGSNSESSSCLLCPHCLPCQFTVSAECPWGYCSCPTTLEPLSFIVGPLECSTIQKRERTHASVVSVELLSGQLDGRVGGRDFLDPPLHASTLSVSIPVVLNLPNPATP